MERRELDMAFARALLFVGLALPLGACHASSDDGSATASASLDTRDAISGTGTAAFLQNWKWRDVQRLMPDLKAAGFTAVLLSPHTATCSGAYGGNGYDPSDYTSFDGGFGSQGDLQYLVSTAHDYGVQIYANMVMNNMCTHGDYSYARFSSNDFHHNGDIQNWSDPWWLENGDLFGLNDLCHECSYVQNELWNFLVKTNDMGFDGYRWDAAKHIPHWFWQNNIVNNTNAWGKYSFGEVFDANPEVLQSYVDTGMAVTDYTLYYAMRSAFSFGGDLSQLDGAGYAARNGAGAATFIENNDVDAPTNRYLAMAFLAAYPGYPFFFNVDLGDANVKNLAWIHTNKARGDVFNRVKEHDVLVFERNHNLIAGINQSGSWQYRWIDTTFPNTKLHDYTGHVDDAWAGADGRVQIAIPPTGWVMMAP